MLAMPRHFLLICLLAALAPWVNGVGQAAPAGDAFPGWPTQFENRPLIALPLSALEESLQKDFPGRVGRFTDGRREIILRWVTRETQQAARQQRLLQGQRLPAASAADQAPRRRTLVELSRHARQGQPGSRRAHLRRGRRPVERRFRLVLGGATGPHAGAVVGGDGGGGGWLRRWPGRRIGFATKITLAYLLLSSDNAKGQAMDCDRPFATRRHGFIPC